MYLKKRKKNAKNTNVQTFSNEKYADTQIH